MNPLLLTIWFGCQAFDATSTIVALQNPMLREGNPVMAKAGIPIRVSVNVLAFLAYRKAERREASKAVRTVPYILAATGCTAGVWNTRQIRSVR
jgi:hypothetical protein